MNTLLELAVKNINYDPAMSENALRALYDEGYQVLVSRSIEDEPWYNAIPDEGEGDDWWFVSLKALMQNQCRIMSENDEESLKFLISTGNYHVIIRWCPMAHQPVYKLYPAPVEIRENMK